MSHYVRNPLIPGQGPKLVLGVRNLRNDVRVDTSALAELTRPAVPRTTPIIPGGEHEYRKADEVAKGLGLGYDQERDLTLAVKGWLEQPDVVAFRSSMVKGLRKMAPADGALRSELARRTLQVWKATRGQHPSRVYGQEGLPQDIIQKAEQLGLFGAKSKAKPKAKPKKQVRGTRPVVGGWEPIPGGKHGGQRRRRGNRYEYRYPDGKGGWSSSPPKPKKKPVVKKKAAPAAPTVDEATQKKITILERRIKRAWEEVQDIEEMGGDARGALAHVDVLKDELAKLKAAPSAPAEKPKPAPPPKAAPEKRSEGEVTKERPKDKPAPPEPESVETAPTQDEPEEPEEKAEPESKIIVVKKDPKTGKETLLGSSKRKHQSAHKHAEPQPPVKRESADKPEPEAKPPKGGTTKKPKPPKPKTSRERKKPTPSEPGWDRMPEVEDKARWDAMTGKEKFDLLQLEGARKGNRVTFTGADYIVLYADGTKSRFVTLDSLREALLQSGKPGAKDAKQTKTKGDPRDSGILGAEPGGPEAGRRADEAAGEGEGLQEAAGEEVDLVAEAESEPHPPEIFDETGIPYAERVPGSPAIKLHADLLPKIPDEVKLSEDVVNFPVPAPLRDSEGKVTGHISKLFSHQQEAAERIRLAWEQGSGCLLQDEAGLGKTNAALAAMVGHGGKRNLIVVPTAGKVGLKKQWMGPTGAGLYGLDVKGAEVVTTPRGKQKLVNQFDDLSATEPGTYIVAYDDLLETVKDANGNPVKERVGKRLVTQKRIRPELIDGTWDTIAFDECHNMKSTDSERAEAAKALMDRADKVLYMSATPFENIKDMHYLTKLDLGFGNNLEEFAHWADKAGASVKGNQIKNPSSPLPMVALAAVMHVDGKSVKRITSMEGCSNNFSKVEMADLTPEQRVTFTKAEEIIDLASEVISGMTLKALYVGWARQYWETLKVPKAIEMGRKARAEGKQVAFFTSYKTANHEHLRAIPRMLHRRADTQEEKMNMGAATALRQKAADIEAIIEHEMEAPTHMIRELVEAFGGVRDVVEIHGATTKKPDQEQEAYQEGRKRVCVATMARGGTGISLHDTTGESPRVQINLSLPWTGREYNQVAGRSHRLGSKSDTHMEWMVGDFATEKDNAKRVSERLQSLGALTIGDPELTKESTNLASWDFAEDYGGAESDDPEDQIAALEELEDAVSRGSSVDTQTAAKAARLHFREYAQLRAEGRDVIAERYKERMERKEKQRILDGRRAAQQLREAYPRLEIKYHPVLGVFEMDEDPHYYVSYKDETKIKNAIRTKVVGAQRKPHLRRIWLDGDGMKVLAEKMGVSKTKVDMKALTAELKMPEGVDRTVAELYGYQVKVGKNRDGELITDQRGNVRLSGGTAQYRNIMRDNGLNWDRGLYAWPCPPDKLDKVLADIKKYEEEKALARHEIMGGEDPPALSGTAKRKEYGDDVRNKAIIALMNLPAESPIRPALVALIKKEKKASFWIDNKWDFMNLERAHERVEAGGRMPWWARELEKSWDGQLERLRPRLRLRPTTNPMELVWMAEEVPDELGVVQRRLPPGWPYGDEILKAKYFKREGSPGNYTYYYRTPGGGVQVVSQKPRTAKRGPRGPYKKTRDREGNTVYRGGNKPPEGGSWEKIPESPHGGMRRPVTSGKVRKWEFWYPGGVQKQGEMFGGAGEGAAAAPKGEPKGGPIKWSKTADGYEARGGNVKIRKVGKKWEMHYYGETIPITTKRPSFDHAEGVIREREAAAEPSKPQPQLELFKALLATGLFDLRKAAGHKYLKRIPTGKVKPKYRYIYKHPVTKQLTSATDLQAGSKFKVEHAGQLGHFEVQRHDAHNGIVTLKHDESGKVAHIREHDLHRMITAHHQKQTKKVTEPDPKQEAWDTERAELRQRLATSEAKRRRAEKKVPKKSEPKGPVATLPRASMADLGKGGYDNIEGFSADARELEVQASLMKGGREYAVIPQAGGFVLASRSKAPAKGVKETKGDKTHLLMRGSAGKALQKVEAEYVVMEASDLIASHDPRSFDPRSEYPEGVQERRYEVRGSGDQGKIDRIAREMEPSLVINTNPSAIDGAPMVTQDGIVLGGNGRTMGMQRAYQLYPERAEQMRDYLQANARAFGVSAGEVAGMKQPILVRRMKVAKADQKAMGRRMNESLTQGMDPRTIEVALGQNYVTPELMDSLTHNMDPEQSLSEFLRSAKSRPFVSALERAGVIDQYNKDEFVEKGTGILNEDGRMRVERVMTARMIPDASVLSRMGSKLRQTIAKSVPAMISMERSGWPVQEALELAVRVDNDMRLEGLAGGKRYSKKAGKKISIPMSEHRESYMKQTSMLEGNLQAQLEKSPMAQLLLEAIQDKANRLMPGKWRQVALEADRQNTPSLGGFVDKRTPEETITATFELQGMGPKKEEGVAEGQTGLFAMSLPDPDLLKAEAEAIGGAELTRYLMHAVLWEVNNLMRAAAGEGGKPSGAQLLARLKAFVKEQAAADKRFAMALGAHPLPDETLRGLLRAAAQARVTDLAKSLARRQLWADWRETCRLAS